MSSTFRVYVVRHGETDWNKTRKLQGQLDVPLNETGVKQSTLLGKALKDVSFERAFSSDLQRAVQTAECILEYQPNVVLETDASIRERYYREPQDGVSGSVPLAETMSEFSARCFAWYTKYVEEYIVSTAGEDGPAEHPRSILVVSHGGWVLTLLVALQANDVLICRKGVEIGYCLNSGTCIIEYADVPSGGERPLVGTLVQYSSVEHLTHENLTPLEVNKDVLGDAWWRP